MRSGVARATGIFAALSVAIIGAAGLVVAAFYKAPEERRAIGLSAAVAFVLQIATFAGVRAMARENVLAGWGAGALARFAVLALYGALAVRSLGMPSGAALISLATFLFLSTLVEPLVLNA
ncbi:MAG: hypothetical protein NVS9B3_10720 [Gemmatimonadaceae bacterium]